MGTGSVPYATVQSGYLSWINIDITRPPHRSFGSAMTITEFENSLLGLLPQWNWLRCDGTKTTYITFISFFNRARSNYNQLLPKFGLNLKMDDNQSNVSMPQ